MWSKKDGSSTPFMAQYFIDARYPVWSPDGGFILLQASRERGATFDSVSDLWVASADGKSAVKTEAHLTYSAAKNLYCSVVTFFWTGDAVIFPPANGGRAGLWEMPR